MPVLCVYGSVKLVISIGWSRIDLKLGVPSVLHEPLVDRNNIIFPLQHIKLAHLKQFFNGLLTEAHCFKYHIFALPSLTFEKTKAMCLTVHQFDGLSKLSIRKFLEL